MEKWRHDPIEVQIILQLRFRGDRAPSRDVCEAVPRHLPALLLLPDRSRMGRVHVCQWVCCVHTCAHTCTRMSLYRYTWMHTPVCTCMFALCVRHGVHVHTCMYPCVWWGRARQGLVTGVLAMVIIYSFRVLKESRASLPPRDPAWPPTNLCATGEVFVPVCA